MSHPLQLNQVFSEIYKGYDFRGYCLSPKQLNRTIVRKEIEFVKLFAEIYKDTNCLNIKTSAHQFTPLHFCVMAGNPEAAETLLSAGADPNCRDSRGWTALHHAAVASNEAMIALLLSFQADPAVRNCHGGTYLDLQNLLNPMQDLSHLRLIDAGQKLTPMTSESFRSLTSAEYISNCKITAIDLWDLRNSVPEQRPLSPLAEKYQFEETDAKKPLLALGKVTKDSEGTPLKYPCGLGLFAGETVAAETILGEYCGLVQTNPEENPYLLRNVDAKSCRNETAQINDGFPNCMIVMLPNSKGLAERYLLVASQTIRKGEQILWNYRFHQVKVDFYMEFAKKEARLFAKQMDIEQLKRGLEIEESERLGDAALLDKVEKFRYLLQTPSTLFCMAHDGTLSVENVKKLYKIACDLEIIPSRRRVGLMDIGDAAERALKDQEDLKKDYPLTSQAFRTLLLDQMMLKGINSVAKTALNMGEYFKQELEKLSKTKGKAAADFMMARSLINAKC